VQCAKLRSGVQADLSSEPRAVHSEKKLNWLTERAAANLPLKMRLTKTLCFKLLRIDYFHWQKWNHYESKDKKKMTRPIVFIWISFCSSIKMVYYIDLNVRVCLPEAVHDEINAKVKVEVLKMLGHLGRQSL